MRAEDLGDKLQSIVESYGDACRLADPGRTGRSWLPGFAGNPPGFWFHNLFAPLRPVDVAEWEDIYALKLPTPLVGFLSAVSNGWNLFGGAFYGFGIRRDEDYAPGGMVWDLDTSNVFERPGTLRDDEWIVAGYGDEDSLEVVLRGDGRCEVIARRRPDLLLGPSWSSYSEFFVSELDRFQALFEVETGQCVDPARLAPS